MVNKYIFEGIHLVEKEERGVRYKIEVPCNMCGECCKRAPENWWLGRNDKGWCRYLEPYENDKFVCTTDMPMGCAKGDYSEEEWCCIKWLQQ